MGKPTKANTITAVTLHFGKLEVGEDRHCELDDEPRRHGIDRGHLHHVPSLQLFPESCSFHS